VAGGGEGGSGEAGAGGAKPPPETRDALGQILDGMSYVDPPAPPPGIDVVAGDGDVVPIAGDSSEDPPAPPPPPAQPFGPGSSFDRPNPFFDDDDDDDDDEDPAASWWSAHWKLVVACLAAVAAVAVGLAVFFSGQGGNVKASQTTSVPPPLRTTPAATPAAPTCPPPTKLEHLTIGAMDHECAGPAQYKSDPNNKYYSYFAWELPYAGRQVQLVVTGGPLHGSTLHATVSPSTAAVSSSGGKLADVDLYDNASGTKNFAKSGSVTLHPSGAVTFQHVVVMVDGTQRVIQGTIRP